MSQIRTYYEMTDTRIPPPGKGDVIGWGDPEKAEVVISVEYLGGYRDGGGRDSDYTHAKNGYMVTVRSRATAEEVVKFLMRGNPGWREYATQLAREAGWPLPGPP